MGIRYKEKQVPAIDFFTGEKSEDIYLETEVEVCIRRVNRSEFSLRHLSSKVVE